MHYRGISNGLNDILNIYIYIYIYDSYEFEEDSHTFNWL